MIFTREEKRTTFIAVGAGAAILLIYYAVPPMLKQSAELGTKLRYLEKLQERARAQNELLARRDDLVKKLGAVTGREGMAAGNVPSPAAPPSPPGPARAASTSQTTPGPSLSGKPAVASASAPAERPKSEVSGPKSLTPPAPKAPPPPSVAVAAYVERQAKAADIRLNSITPTTPARSYKEGKSLTPVGLQVSMETSTAALVKLLHALEKGNRLIRIEQVDIRRDIKKGPNVTVTLYIVGYEASAR